eukprot:Plantae.Rhodophyta-Hildenbrandia_rubra.ctg14588.p2 GENE.Plantae.Rhodophyta-Hildenbrandia_rubra.ctg14588~~Plantae.Rhodophyta-Hildenbrandia_rubra.ctg14588.p2  ORF type:complete len:255 (+),score=57.07 Plantae.Rhodophyta-Hildenbrandia_rubra.ctg14588:157-921(+)
MTSIGTGYDLSTTTFSPDGRVFQIEYATKAVENSGTVIGLRCKDGVVLSVEKPVISKMLVPGSLRRCHIIDEHACVTICGLISDGRVLVKKAREEAEDYENTYGDKVSGKVLVERLASFVHMYTLQWFVRPFGCAGLVGVWGEKGPELYLIEPSGVSYKYYAVAYGKGKQAAKTELERLGQGDGVSCKDAVNELAKIFMTGRDESKDKESELEMIWITEETGKRCQPVPAEVVEKAVADAKKKLAEDDEDMDES